MTECQAIHPQRDREEREARIAERDARAKISNVKQTARRMTVGQAMHLQRDLEERETKIADRDARAKISKVKQNPINSTL